MCIRDRPGPVEVLLVARETKHRGFHESSLRDGHPGRARGIHPGDHSSTGTRMEASAEKRFRTPCLQEIPGYSPDQAAALRNGCPLRLHEWLRLIGLRPIRGGTERAGVAGILPKLLHLVPPTTIAIVTRGSEPTVQMVDRQIEQTVM